MALIDKDFFVYPIDLATSNPKVVVLLDKIIEVIEGELLPLVTYDITKEEEVSDIKNMIGFVVYKEYCEQQLKKSTDIGFVNQSVEGSEKVGNLAYAYTKYNEAMDIFNKYVTLEENMVDPEVYNLNTLGI